MIKTPNLIELTRRRLADHFKVDPRQIRHEVQNTVGLPQTTFTIQEGTQEGEKLIEKVLSPVKDSYVRYSDGNYVVIGHRAKERIIARFSNDGRFIRTSDVKGLSKFLLWLKIARSMYQRPDRNSTARENKTKKEE